MGGCTSTFPRRIPAEHGGQVEAQPIDVHVRDPVAQAGEHEVADDGVVAVNGVAAAGEIEVGAGGPEEVVELVIEAPEGIGSASVVPLAGVVEDDVENHLDAGLVEDPDHFAEFHDLPASWALCA